MTMGELENILAREKDGKKGIVTIRVHRMDGESAVMIRLPHDKVTLSAIRARMKD